MYVCVRGIDFVSIRFWNCPDCVVLFVFDLILSEMYSFQSLPLTGEYIYRVIAHAMYGN